MRAVGRREQSVRRRWRTRGGARRGFTLIEAMVALVVLVVGVMGLLGLQRATMRGNQEARQITVATQLARLWVERLKRDALLWTQPGSTGLMATRFLRAAPAAGTAGDWFTPVDPAPDPDDPLAYAFDYQGRDTTDPAQMVYCTHVRLSWIDPTNPTALRVDVRLWWHRRGSGTTSASVADLRLFPNCGLGMEAGVTRELDAPVSRLRAVYASTIVRWMRQP